jgi:polyphosphate kinase
MRPAQGEPVRNTHRRLMHRALESVPDEEQLALPGERTARREPSVELEEVFTDGNEP